MSGKAEYILGCAMIALEDCLAAFRLALLPVVTHYSLLLLHAIRAVLPVGQKKKLRLKGKKIIQGRIEVRMRNEYPD